MLAAHAAHIATPAGKHARMDARQLRVRAGPAVGPECWSAGPAIIATFAMTALTGQALRTGAHQHTESKGLAHS